MPAVFFVLIAHIALLAHAVIPHHHHDKISVAICWHDGTVLHHVHSEGGVSHEPCSGKAEKCSVNETLFILQRTQDSVCDAADDGSLSVFLPFLFGGTAASEFGVCPKNPEPRSDKIPIGTKVRPCGLRAPPAC